MHGNSQSRVGGGKVKRATELQNQKAAVLKSAEDRESYDRKGMPSDLALHAAFLSVYAAVGQL